jgi:hypothetical protein
MSGRGQPEQIHSFWWGGGAGGRERERESGHACRAAALRGTTRLSLRCACGTDWKLHGSLHIVAAQKATKSAHALLLSPLWKWAMADRYEGVLSVFEFF